MPRDAQRLPWRPVGPDAATTRTPRVWVRLGRWLRGSIVYWEPAPGIGAWDIWLQHDSIDHPDTDWSEHHWYRYDPETIRPRVDDEPPDD